MKKSVVIVGASLVAALFSFSSQADEREIKSTGNAFLTGASATFKYDLTL